VKRSDFLIPYIVAQLVNSSGEEYSVAQLVSRLQYEIGEFVVTAQAVREAIKRLPEACVRLDRKTGRYMVHAREFAKPEEVYEACCAAAAARGMETDGIPMMFEPIFPFLQYELVMRGHHVWAALEHAHQWLRGNVHGAKFAFKWTGYGHMIAVRKAS
jgi:hypothetical protein